MWSKPLKLIGKQEEWCILCQGNGHTLASCEFIPEVKKLLVARALRREEKRVIKKIKTEVTKEVKRHRNVGGGDTEEPDRLPLVSPAHIRSGVVSLYSEPYHQTLNIYDSPILALSHNSRTVYLILDTGATTSLAIS